MDDVVLVVANKQRRRKTRKKTIYRRRNNTPKKIMIPTHSTAALIELHDVQPTVPPAEPYTDDVGWTFDYHAMPLPLPLRCP